MVNYWRHSGSMLRKKSKKYSIREASIISYRRVSCKDLGKGDCEGWLYRRRTKGGGPLSSHWQKRWCVIKNYDMFCYHDKEAEKAESVVHLPAFQVSPLDPSQLKTKKFAFKIHNAGTSFIFASDRQEDMSKWMNKMGLAAISFDESVKKPGKYKGSAYKDFSESEEEDNDGTSHSLPRSRDPSPDRDVKDGGGGLRAPPPELRGSQVDLPTILRRQSEKAQNIYGEDKNIARKSALARDAIEQISPEVLRVKKLKSLERTLKAKEKELMELEDTLASRSPEKLHMWQDVLGGHSVASNETDSD